MWDIVYIALKKREKCMQTLDNLDMINKELMRMMDRNKVDEFGVDSRFLNMLISNGFDF